MRGDGRFDDISGGEGLRGPRWRRDALPLRGVTVARPAPEMIGCRTGAASEVDGVQLCWTESTELYDPERSEGARERSKPPVPRDASISHTWFRAGSTTSSSRKRPKGRFSSDCFEGASRSHSRDRGIVIRDRAEISSFAFSSGALRKKSGNLGRNPLYREVQTMMMTVMPRR